MKTNDDGFFFAIRTYLSKLFRLNYPTDIREITIRVNEIYDTSI